MSLPDLLLIVASAIGTALLIRFIQSRPIEGLVGVMDLIVPHRDPQLRMLWFSLTIVVPAVVGAVVSLAASDKMIVASFGPGLGAFISVSTAFFRPDTILPEIRTRLRTVQGIYLALVAGYASLGAMGALIMAVVVETYERQSIVNNLTSSLVWLTITTLISQVGAAGGRALLDAKLNKRDQARTSDLPTRAADIPQPTAAVAAGGQAQLTSQEVVVLMRTIVKEELAALSAPPEDHGDSQAGDESDGRDAN